MQSETTNEDKMKQLLQEWLKWINTYGSLIGVGSELENLYERTKEVVTKSNGS